MPDPLSGVRREPAPHEHVTPREVLVLVRLARRRETGAFVERDRAEVGLVGVELDARRAARPRPLQRGIDERSPDAAPARLLLDEEVLEPAVGRPGPDRVAVAQLADA